MTTEIDASRIADVEGEVQRIYGEVFPHGDVTFVGKVFGWANNAFTGKYRDYQAIDARYHNLEHTLQVTLCLARLLRGRHFAGATPELSQRIFELAILAILLHDTGYLKKRGDNEGTGAKYTWVHVERSAEFAGEMLREDQFSPSEIQAVKNMIRCTGVNVKLDSIPFQNEEERIAGFALGTGDLLGQMASRDYISKLPILYVEFAEASQFNKGRMDSEGMFSSAEDLMEKTPAFWEKFVKRKIENDFLSQYRFLNDPYPDGENWYVRRIEENIARIC